MTTTKPKIEQTLCILKPHIVESDAINKVCKRLLELEHDKVFHPTNVKMLHFDKDPDLLKKLYYEHVDKDYFQAHSDYMCSGMCMAYIFEGEDVIARWRKEMIELRKLYGKNITENGFHGSDSPKSAAYEIALIFDTSSAV